MKSLLKLRMMLKLNRKKKIMLDIKAGDVVNDEEILAEIFKNH